MEKIMRDQEILPRLQRIGSTVFADVMDMDNSMDYQIKPINFNEPLVGRVRTVSLPTGDNLFLHHSIYQAEEGEVLIVDGKGCTSTAYLGELMASAAQKAGLKGIIIDGLVRDKRELQSLDIQVYAKGCIPSGPSKDGPGSFDKTITCGGVVVSPHDFLVADEDGVVIISQTSINQTLEKAERKLEYENNRLDKIHSFTAKNGESVNSIKPDWLDQEIKKYL